jgi:hypothetical protein
VSVLGVAAAAAAAAALCVCVRAHALAAAPCHRPLRFAHPKHQRRRHGMCVCACLVPQAHRCRTRRWQGPQGCCCRWRWRQAGRRQRHGVQHHTAARAAVHIHGEVCEEW